MDKNYSAQKKLGLLILPFFAAFFIMGTFFDKTAAEALFSPDFVPAKLLTALGVYPFYAAQVFFWGALSERAIHSDKSKAFRAALCIIFVLSALLIGFIGGKSMTGRNNLGSIYPSLIGNIPAVIISSLILEYPLFLAGYLASKKSQDKLLVKRIIVLFAVLLAAYLSLELLKNLFDRPRYRTAVLGYEGIGFVPWYTPFAGADTYAAEYGLPADEFRSFPSGHSLFSSLTMCIFPSLAWVFPKLRDKQLRLFLGGLFFCLVIMLTRMILGAHYLSDVSAGAITGTLSAILFYALQLRISKSSKQ